MKQRAATIVGRERRASKRAKYAFQLYVTGTTPKSTEAILGVKHLLEEHLKGLYALEVIDIYQEPLLAGLNKITVVPTLVRKRPLPSRKIVGRLGCKEYLLGRLELISGQGIGKGRNGEAS